MRGIKYYNQIAFIFKQILNLQRINATAVLGVSKYLSSSFPPIRYKRNIFTISDIRISNNHFLKPKKLNKDKYPKKIVCSGRVEIGKNPIGVINALSNIDKMNFHDWEFKWVGDGPLLDDAIKHSRDLGLEGKIEFTGFLPWEEVICILGESDLFILNSYSEGMPRSLIEAMACSLPCIGTDIKGIDELLPKDALVPINSHDELARKVVQILTDENRYYEMSEQNYSKAKQFSKDKLIKKQISFYKFIEDFTRK